MSALLESIPPTEAPPPPACPTAASQAAAHDATASHATPPVSAIPSAQPSLQSVPSVLAPDWFVWACPCCQATLRTLSTARRGNCPACGSLIEAPEPPAAAPTPPPATSQNIPSRIPRWLANWRRALVPAGVAAALGIVGTSALMVVRAQPWKRLGFGPPSPAAIRPPTTEELKQQLDAFVRANGWPAKRAFILDPERLEARAREYCQGRDPDTLTTADFQTWSTPGASPKSGVLALRAERPGHRPIIAAFGPTKQGWKLDWELFTQTYDESFPQFLANPAFPIRTFRAKVQRVFDPPAPENALALAVSDPLDAGQRVVVHLPMGTPIATDVTRGLPDTRERPATVELCWARPTPDGEWVPMLQRLVCWGWNGLTGRPEPGIPAADANERFTLPSAPPLASAPPAAESIAAATTPPASAP